MAFRPIKFVETDAEETARLALAPEGSNQHTLSLLPVTNPYPDKGQVLELPSSANWRGHRIVGTPLERRGGPSANGPLPHKHDGAWNFRILASDHDSYPVGGYDIVISTSELRRARIIEL